jgi:ppGpp synthetase/RelA/SpoT-type nucleotidyltranferase
VEEQEFLKRFCIPESQYRQTGLDWSRLAAIRGDYEKTIPELGLDARYVAERLRPVESVHTVKTRIKSPDHLIEKIIRIKLADPGRTIELDNYDLVVTDLVGVRALHLFKEDWALIHDFILQTWELMEPPVANIHPQDPPSVTTAFRERRCAINQHPWGYRSVHYLIAFERSKDKTLPVEIQVRTLLEEAWSEIDHYVRYSRPGDASLFAPHLAELNRLTARADEVSSVIRRLKNDTASKASASGPLPLPNEGEGPRRTEP